MKSFGLPRLKFEPRPNPTNTFLGKGYQDNPYLHLDYSGYHKKLHPITVYKQFILQESTFLGFKS